MKKIKDLGMRQSGSRRRRFFMAECMCGNIEVIRGDSKRNYCEECISKLRADRAKKDIRDSDSPNWRRYHNIKQRCYNQSNKSYRYYGLRGISMSDEFFNSFNIFDKYVSGLEQANQKGYTLDRIDNDGNYARGNLKWSLDTEQRKNTRLIHSDNTSGYRGVSYHKLTGKYVSYVSNKHIGLFPTKLEAAKARDKYIDDNNLIDRKNFNETI